MDFICFSSFDGLHVLFVSYQQKLMIGFLYLQRLEGVLRYRFNRGKNAREAM